MYGDQETWGGGADRREARTHGLVKAARDEQRVRQHHSSNGGRVAIERVQRRERRERPHPDVALLAAARRRAESTLVDGERADRSRVLLGARDLVLLRHIPNAKRAVDATAQQHAPPWGGEARRRPRQPRRMLPVASHHHRHRLSVQGVIPNDHAPVESMLVAACNGVRCERNAEDRPAPNRRQGKNRPHNAPLGVGHRLEGP